MNLPSLALVALFCTCASTLAQEPQLAIVNLKAAVYPPMAVAARVSGEVILNVTLAQGGSTNTVEVESGPPMLRDAAVESAKRSQFQGNPENRTSVYRLVYRFDLDQPTKCEHDDSYPRVKQDANLVTITQQPILICDPRADSPIRVRSPKCLYLWKCGSRWPL